VLFEEERIPTKIFRRDRLPAGAQVAGSLVIEEDTATTVVPPGWGARVDELGNVIITQEGS
jgi:N-methylhydantoinase A/oxoprolinase/acetone carboxylase beta subunit